MIVKKHSAFVFALLFTCCSKEKPATIQNRIQQTSAELAALESRDDLEGFMKHYAPGALCLPEYEITRNGKSEIEAFYKEIFQRQSVQTYQQETDEVISLDSTYIEIGSFHKEYRQEKTGDTLQTQDGQYWHVWQLQPNGELKLKGESFGFFHPIKYPETLVAGDEAIQPNESHIDSIKTIPFELKAYNALMEKWVRTREGAKRAQFFLEEGSFKPFAEPVVSGERIKPYLIQYSSRGTVSIDQVMVYTLHFEYHEPYLLEYTMFKVKWSVPNYSGRTEGKGIRIWQRQADHSLRLFREIGTHNYVK